MWLFPSLATQYGPAWDGVVEAIDAVERGILVRLGRRTSTGEPIPAVSENNGLIRALRIPEEDAAVIRHATDWRDGLMTLVRSLILKLIFNHFHTVIYKEDTI